MNSQNEYYKRYVASSKEFWCFWLKVNLLSKAFYQRGLTKMKLKHAKGIHDFNRALAINPTLFQVS